MAIGCSKPVTEIVSTTDGTTFDFGSFTPAANCTLVILALCRDTLATGSITNVSGTSLAWTKKTSAAFNSGTDTMYCFWANTGSSTAASVYRVDLTGDSSTGCIAYMFQFTGTDLSLVDPIRQVGTNNGSGTSANFFYPSNPYFYNGVCSAWMGALSSSNPANVSTQPTGWTEAGDNGFATPTSNASGAYAAGAQTTNFVSFTSASTTFGIIGCEVWAADKSIRFDCGTDGPFTDGAGNVWAIDAYYTGATSAFNNFAAIANTTDDRLYESERYGNPINYNIPVPNGRYAIRLCFAELYFGPVNGGGVGSRIFSITCEGATVVTNLDISAQVGAMAAYDINFYATVSDGSLDFVFTASADQAKINGMQILPAPFVKNLNVRQAIPRASYR